MISIPIRSRVWLGAGLIALIAACGGAGKPSVKLTATPTSLEDGQVITLKAEVSGGQGKMLVEFYKGSEKVGVDDTAPYETSLPITANDDVTLAFTAKATAADKQTGSSEAVNVSVKVDKVPPTVTLTTSSPKLNSLGSVTLMATATDNKKVVKVEFYKGASKLGESTTPTDGVYSLNVALTADDNGTQVYTAKAYDAKGNVGTSPQASVEVEIDVTAPTVSLSANKTSVTTAGSVTLTANASDNKGVAKVEFYEGESKIGEATESPYTLSISYTAANNGNHTYSAKAYDAKNNSAESSTVTVVVDIDATLPVVKLKTDQTSITKAGSATLTAEASDDKGVTKVEFYEGANKIGEDTDAPYEHVLNFPLSEANNDDHSYTAKAYDGNSNSVESDAVVIKVDIDATVPVFASFTATPTSLSAPGKVDLSADVSDNKGVSKVEFYKGANKLGEDSEAPYAFEVDYNASYKATDSFSAKAFDAAGNSADSASVDVAVDIDITKPEVTLSAPATITEPGTLTLTAQSSDNTGVTKLEFYRVESPTNTLIKTVNDPLASQTHELDIKKEDNAIYKFMVKAFDAKGNVQDSNEVTVEVRIEPNITKFEAASGSSLTVSDAGGTVNLVWDGDYVLDYSLEVGSGASANIPGPGNTSGTVTVPANPSSEAKTYTVTLKAKAYGSTGIADDTATLDITVEPDTTAPTNVVLKASDSEVTEPTTVDLEVTADDNHAVTKVEFFKNGNSIGEDTDSAGGFTLSADIESGDVGTAVFSAKVFDGAGNSTDSANVDVTVNAAMSFTSGYTNATLTANQPNPYSSTPAVSGGTGNKAYSVDPSLPAGLSIDSSTGEISGTPSAAAANATYTVTVTDDYGATKTTTLDLTVNAAPSVGTNYVSTAIAAINRLFTSSTPVVADGTGPFSFAVSPALPADLEIDSSTGVISGTPTGSTTPPVTYTVTATDANGASVNFSIVIDVNTAPALSYTVSRNLTVGRQIQKANFFFTNNYNVSTSGGTGTKTYAVFSGSLPNGLSVDSGDGDILGTPTTAGSFSAVIRVTDAAGYTTDATFAIEVKAAPTISFTAGADVSVSGNTLTMDNDNISVNEVIATFSATDGVGPMTYSDGGGNGNLFNPRFSFSGSGVITSDEGGNNLSTHAGFTRTFTVTDANGATASVTLTFVVNP